MRYFILAAVILSAFGVLFAQGTTTPNLDEVIAEVNGEKITVGDFLAEFRRLSADVKQRVLQGPAGRTEVLNSIIRKKLLIAEAKKLGIDTLSSVKREVQRYAEDIYARVLLNQVARQAGQKVTDEQAKKFYEANDSIFDVTTNYHFAKLVFADKDLAYQVSKKLKDGSISWDDAVKKYPGAGDNRSGDAGWIYENRLKPKVVEALKKLKPGEVSEPIEIGGTYYILKLIEKEPPRHLSFDEVKDRIKSYLSQRAGRMAMDAYQNKLWMQAKISIDNRVLQSVPLESQK